MIKSLLPLLLLAAVIVQAQDADPTQPSARMRSAMMAKGSSIPAMSVKGIVIGAGRKGIVLLEAAGPVMVVARPEVPFNLVVDSIPFQLLVKQINEQGIEIENSAAKETVLLPSYVPLDAGASTPPGANITYLELRDAPLMEALRMISDQSGSNYSVSSAANKTPVSAFLRNIPAEAAVEEICKSHNLWFKKDENTNITRIMDVKEFEKDLVGFREEKTEVFTLLYPNAVDVAYSIADVFGESVELSLGNQDSDADARDLESRFDRFNIIGRGNLTANSFQGSSTTYSGTNGASSFGGGGGYTSAGGGGGISTGGGAYRQTLDASYRNRYNRQQDQLGQNARDLTDRFTLDTASQAQSAVQALAMDATDPRRSATLNRLRTVKPSIYVSASRRNNTIAVRTADPNVMTQITELVHRLDVPTPLVLLEVKVLRVTLGKGFQSAFDYAITDGTARGGIGAGFSTGTISPGVTTDPITGAVNGVTNLPGQGSTGLRDGQFVFQYLSENVSARLQVLETENRLNTIASPTLLTSHNEVSRLFLGEERPLVRNISSQTILTDNNAATTPNTQIEFRSVGTTLLITPNINSDRTVTLRLLQENSAINKNAATIPVVTSQGLNGAATGVTNVLVDTVASRSVSGTFAAADGKAVIVGGLIEDEDRNTQERVPVLGRIPVLGVLFRRQDKNKGKSEMIVIIRPHILSTPADGEKISKNLLQDLSTPARQRLQEAGYLSPTPLLPPLGTAPRAEQVADDRAKIPVRTKPRPQPGSRF